MPTEAKALPKQGWFDRLLSGFEKAANKLPTPFTMFVELFVIVAVLSLVFSLLGLSAINPADGKEVVVSSFFSRQGLTWLLNNLVKNFTGYAPLGLVLTMNFGIGMCEEVGLVKSLLKKTMANVPPRLLTYAICWIGCMGNLASDAASVILPPLAGMMFLGAGRNPILGFICARAAGAVGFHTNMLLAGTDALAQGITNNAITIASNNPAMQVDITCNYYFMFVMTVIVTVVCTFITEKIVGVRLGEYTGEARFAHEPLDAAANKGLRYAGIALLVYLAVILAGVLPGNGLLRASDGSLTDSPFLQGMIPILFGLFLTSGLGYGIGSGFIKSERDVPKILSHKTGVFNGYIVQVFAVSQFVAIFNWTKIGNISAIFGANALKSSGFVGIPLIVCFMLLTSVVGFFISSNSACWSLMAPIFVPMFMYLGYQPAFTQLVFRSGMSILGLINPLSVYLYMILTMIQTQYDKDFSLGKMLSLSVPYVIAAAILWIGAVIVVLVFNLPIGPGVGVFIPAGMSLSV